MNFLAHAYLSFQHPEFVVGNMISDFVKGKAQYDYPPLIQAGIQLHRSIDAFTDEHWATKKAQQIFRPYYRLYSGPIIDILYDHFLATDTTVFESGALAQFSAGIYTILETQSFYLPQRFLTMLPYMKAQDWLFNYSTKQGIERSLQGLVRRSAYLTESDTAFTLFNSHYSFLQDCYTPFFKDVKTHAEKKMAQLLL